MKRCCSPRHVIDDEGHPIPISPIVLVPIGLLLLPSLVRSSASPPSRGVTCFLVVRLAMKSLPEPQFQLTLLQYITGATAMLVDARLQLHRTVEELLDDLSGVISSDQRVIADRPTAARELCCAASCATG